MAVIRGTVSKRAPYIQTADGKIYMPKGCDPIIGPQIQALAGTEVEVLVAKNTVLAIRVPREAVGGIIKVPRIYCYFCPAHIAFDPDIMTEIGPIITKSLVKSGYLDNKVAEEIAKFH